MFQQYSLLELIQSLKIGIGQVDHIMVLVEIMDGEETMSLVILILCQVIQLDNGLNINQEKIGTHSKHPLVRNYVDISIKCYPILSKF